MGVFDNKNAFDASQLASNTINKEKSEKINDGALPAQRNR